MSSHPRLIPLLCSNHHQIRDITSLSYVSALRKFLKQVVNKTENNLTLKIKFCLYIHICKILFDASNCKYKVEINVQILHYYEYLQSFDHLGMSFIVKSFILKVNIYNK